MWVGIDGPIVIDQSGRMQQCMQVDWPAQGAWLNLHEKPDDFHPKKLWMGSLLAHGRDASGQYYRRNRYYDSSTGRFTQEDPIGLAGGINLYGFANGDPVAYDDPYGLCIWSKDPVRRASGGMCTREEAGRVNGGVEEPLADPTILLPIGAVAKGSGIAARAAGRLAGNMATRAAAGGIAALTRVSARGALNQIQRAGQLVGRLHLGQNQAANLLKNVLGRLNYEIGDDVVVDGTRYLVSANTSRSGTSHALAIGADGKVTNAVLREVKPRLYEVVQ